MKKLLLLLLASLLLLSACGKGVAETPTEEETKKPTAYEALTGYDKEFFDAFKNYIPQFNDPSSVRVTQIYYIETQTYGNYFLTKVNARNGFGGIATTQYVMSDRWIGTVETRTAEYQAASNYLYALSRDTSLVVFFDLDAIHLAVREYLEEKGLA